jgi:pilus assembly protein FimV
VVALRYFVKKTTFLLVVYPIMASAVGLGEIVVHSTLNESLSADVPVIDVAAIPLNEIEAKLASIEEFERIGLDRSAYTHLLKFDVIRDKKKATVVHISTQSPMNEPIVTVLFSLTAAGTQLLREYTVFLDPPDYRHGTIVVPVSSRMKVLQQNVVPTKPFLNADVAARTAVPVEARHVIPKKQPTKSSVSTETYVVKHNDALWTVAGHFTTEDVSRYQVMLAIFEKNPDAFRKNNGNGLKQNTVLMIPSQQEIAAISREQAIHIFAEQEKRWRGKSSKVQTVPPKSVTPSMEMARVSSLDQTTLPVQNTQPTSAVMDPTEQTRVPNIDNTVEFPLSTGKSLASMGVGHDVLPEPAKQSFDVLKEKAMTRSENKAINQTAMAASFAEKPELSMKIVEKEVEGSAINAPKQTHDSVAEIKQLRAELAIAMDTLNASQQTNNLLRQKIQAMQQRNQLPQDVQTEVGQVIDDDKALLNQAETPHDMRKVELPQPLPVEALKPMPKDRQEKAAVLPGLQTQDELRVNSNNALLEQKKALALEKEKNMLWVSRTIGFIILLITGGVWFGLYTSYQHRKRVLALRREQAKSRVIPIEHVPDEKKTVEKVLLANKKLSGKSQASAANTQKSSVQKSSVAEGSDDIDTLEEIDVYIAYGRYEQALKTLQTSIQAQPKRAALKVKLLEVQAEMNDQEKFTQTLAQLPANFAAKNPDLWETVEALKKKIHETAVSNNQNDSEPQTFKKQVEYEDVDIEHIKAMQTGQVEKPAYVPTKVIDFGGEGIALGSEDSLPESAEEEVDEGVLELADDDVAESVEELGDVNPELEQAIAKKFDIVQVYIDTADYDEACSVLEEIIKTGSPEHKERAQAMLKTLDAG